MLARTRRGWPLHNDLSLWKRMSNEVVLISIGIAAVVSGYIRFWSLVWSCWAATDLNLFNVEYYRDHEMWVRRHWRSLKVVPFESLGTVFYSPFIVTMGISLAISEIFSIKEWFYLEICVWGRSRYLKMARFDRPCMTFYWSAIVTIALCCTVRPCPHTLRCALRCVALLVERCCALRLQFVRLRTSYIFMYSNICVN